MAVIHEQTVSLRAIYALGKELLPWKDHHPRGMHAVTTVCSLDKYALLKSHSDNQFFRGTQ